MSDDWGAPQEYTVYNGAKSQTFQFKPYQPLSDIRTALEAAGFMTDTDAFLYENPATKLKTVFTPTSAEKNSYLGVANPRESGAAFPPVPAENVNTPIVQIVSIAKDTPSFLGMSPTPDPDGLGGWLRQNPVMGVRCRLNDIDQAAIDNNQGMFQPVMLQNVVSANPDNPAFFSNCVISQKGAIVMFDISSWGAAGWAYSITSAMGKPIVPDDGWLYSAFDGKPGNEYDRQTQANQRSYYQEGGNGPSIQLKANEALGIATQYNVQYSTLTFKAWSLYQTPIGASNTPIPAGVADADDSFEPGPPAGAVTIPGGTTAPATTTAGPPSKQGYATALPGPVKPDSPPTSRSGGLTGELQIYCMVFDSEEDARTVIKVLNAGTMGFGG